MSGDRKRTVSIAAVAVAAGAAGEYFLDPEGGKRRRHMARDRGLALLRRPTRGVVAKAERRASYAKGVVKGMAHEATTPAGERDPERLNDQGLAAKIQSEVFRETPNDSVNVNVESGVAHLRGALDSRAEIDRLVQRVQEVEGVKSVHSLLHVPGEPAPTRV